MFEDDTQIEEFEELLEEIASSKRWKGYRYICANFARYLTYTASNSLEIHGYDTYRCKPVVRTLDYVHRWTDIYRRGQYWKFSRLEEWWTENKTEVYFLTLTTSGKGKTIIEALQALRDGWEALSANLRYLRKEKGILEYVWVFEPHLGKHGTGINLGYPHMHVIIFTNNLTKSDIHRLKKLWSKKYQLGSYTRGAYFDTNRKDEKVDVQHLRAYLLKYIQKTISLEDISVPHFVFLACVWNFYDKRQWTEKKCVPKKNGGYRAESTGGGAFRLWGASRNLTRVMKFQKTGFDTTSQYINYARHGEEIPEIVAHLSKKSLSEFLSGKESE